MRRNTSESKDANEYYDLGDYHRTVSTSDPEAQVWFDRGLVWAYSFNHEEAIACFERAIECDNSLAMAHWGVAYAMGPNYNKAWEMFDGEELEASVEITHGEIGKARALQDSATDVERMLIEALSKRYRATSSAELSPASDHDYADVFDRALDQPSGLRHPGLLHFYIHLMEMSFTPEAALTIADHLRKLVPDAGHMLHMPSHLDILCGDYRRAIESNTDAIRADEKFLHREGAMNFYTLYRSHNYHFRIYAAMFSGQSAIALEAAGQLEESIPEDLLKVTSPPMADWIEGFLAMRVHVYIRFGRWQEIIDLPFPTGDPEIYCVTIAMQHYARGVAFASLGRVDEATTARTLFREALTRVPESRTLFNNTCIDILEVASSMLDGELEYRKGNVEEAFHHLRRSIELDDSLPYDEPWGWMQPTRHAYGALLLEQGQVEQAAAIYAADLRFDATLPRAQQHPGNVWALHGYHECLTRLGRTAEAEIVGNQLKFAVAVADVPVKASCFCRLSAVEDEHEHHASDTDSCCH